MENIIDAQSGIEQKKDGQLRAILYLLQSKLEEYSDEVNSSYELLKIGEKTNLTQNIESTIDDPFGSIAKMTGNIDDKIKSIIDVFVKSFFKHKNDLINSVYKSSTCLDDLYYSIVLKEDNYENRNSIFEFFDVFDIHEISKKYPVYFQFTPVEFVDKIVGKEQITFN